MLFHDFPEDHSTVLYDVDEEEIIERLKTIIEIKETGETQIEVTQEHINKVQKYLIMLDLLVNCTERYESGSQSEHVVFSQPGMRFAIAKALVYSLMQDAYFNSISEKDKEYIVAKILDDVKGRMLEDIVLLETFKTASKDEEVFQFRFDVGGEYDMVIYDKKNHTCRIYEIKHSTQIAEKQMRHLIDADKCKTIEERFGKISGKYVLYRGENKTIEDVEYMNVEQFLCELNHRS